MEPSSNLLPPTSSRTDEFAETCGKYIEDFADKLTVRDQKHEEEEEEEGREEHFDVAEGEGNYRHGHDNDDGDDEEEEKEEEEEEFSFACTNLDGSPVSADDVFQNGQIRTVFPLFNRDLLFGEGNQDGVVWADDKAVSLRPPLKKLFVEGGNTTSASSASESPIGPYCDWSARTVQEASPETCKKSNSTGFSKLWRFRELVLRSNSDGKDAFVFLNHNHNHHNHKHSQNHENKRSSSSTNVKGIKEQPKSEKGAGGKIGRARKGKGETVSSAHEMHYVRNRASKHKSYLPYRQDLVGFFTNVNGLSRNVHPF